MRRLSKQIIILISGTFLMVGVATADSDRNDRGRKYENSFRDCGNSRNCRFTNSREHRHNRDDDRRYRHDRDDDHRYRHDNRRPILSHYHDNKSKTRVELRISTYPQYINSDRRSHYGRRSPPSRVISYDYRPYYYRDYVPSYYPGPQAEYAPRGTVIHWNDNSNQGSVASEYNGQQAEDRYCREYTTDSVVQGRTQQVFGTACLQPDGSWQIIN